MSKKTEIATVNEKMVLDGCVWGREEQDVRRTPRTSKAIVAP